MDNGYNAYAAAVPDSVKIEEALKNHVRAGCFSYLPDYRSDEQIRAGTGRYVDGDYLAINAYLNDPRNRHAYHPFAPEDLKSIIADILSDMRPLSHAVTVFRGIQDVTKPNAYSIGKSVTVTALTSTSVSREVATLFANGEYLMQLRIPTGTPAIVTNQGEQEIIVPPGVRFNFTHQYDNVRFPYIEYNTGNPVWTTMQRVLIGNVDMGG